MFDFNKNVKVLINELNKFSLFTIILNSQTKKSTNYIMILASILSLHFASLILEPVHNSLFWKSGFLADYFSVLYCQVSVSPKPILQDRELSL